MSKSIGYENSDPGLFSGGKSILISGVTDISGKKTDIFIDQTGIIINIGETALKNKRDADLILDGSDRLVIPSLVNTHTHAAMSLLRGFADDMNLQQWLSEKIWPLEAHLTGDDVYHGTKLACLEMIRSGTTAFNDMYFFMENAAKAVDEAGMRALLCYGLITFGDEEKFEKEAKATTELADHVKSMNNPKINVAVGPHAPYSVPPQHLSWCAQFAEERKIPIHIHLSETEQEVVDCKKNYGKGPVQVLDEAGILTDHTIAAHGCWLDEADCELLSKRGVSMAHNPVSNMKLSTCRMMPYSNLISAGVNVTIGTDGSSSNNNLDMLEEVKFAAIGQKFFWKNETILPANEAFNMATINGAKALQMPCGLIKEGMAADLVLLDLTHPSMVPCYNPVSNIVYSATGAAVKTVLCGGKILMEEGYIPWEEECIREAGKVAEDLVTRE